MGCQLHAYGAANVELNWSSGSYLVMGLTRRWLVDERDRESDGWYDGKLRLLYQDRIDASSIELLSKEAPTTVDKFRAYCLAHEQSEAAEMSDDQLYEIRNFIAA